MQLELADWQTRLARHFTELQRRRGSEAPDRPIFGLEHGLGDAEVKDLSSAIRAHIQHRGPCWDHRLPWVVYASEFGYVYTGDEYWQTFEAQTPGWDRHGDRHWIRGCFRDFHQCYGGAKPTGAWARHFSIICWPITHAILPRDLQRQLAHLLYDLRYALSPEVLESPRQLGELIAARSWNTSSRFQQLTEEPLFVGQIAAALLLQGNGIASSLINPFTLARISADLDRERRARAWLRGARESAQRRVEFQHIQGQGIGHGVGNRGMAEEAKSGTTLGFEPRLILHPLEGGVWQVRVELPDLSGLPLRFPHLKNALLNSRCWVSGSSGRRKPGAWLLYGPQSVTLIQWPRHDEPLLQFENPPPELDHLLRTECLLRPGPIWLFKVSSDGLACELKGATVRPGQRYVALLEEGRNLPTHPQVAPGRVDCDGVQAFELHLHETIGPELGEALTALGIPEAGTVRVWPAGLSPAGWDGEGVAEWLSTDRPCVGIRADHYVETFSLDVGGDRIDISPSALGVPIFVELPQLDPGIYALHVTASGQRGETVAASGSLQVHIREPRVWAPGGNSQSAFLVIVDPAVPTLEQLWEGDVNLEVHGPASRRVQCDIAFFERGNSQPFLQKQLPSLRLPIDDATWQRHFNQHFKKHAEVQNAYDLAHSCLLQLRADEVGTFTLAAERDFSPLRWAVRRAQDRFFLRVLDDSGAEQAAQVSLYWFEAPDIEQARDISSFDRAEGEIASVGLYVARTGDYVRSVVIPAEVHTFQDLRVEPRLSSRKRTAGEILELIQIIELWAGARMTGNLFSLVMRRDVLLALVREIFRLVAGDRWAEVEALYGRGTGTTVQPVTGLLKKREESDLAAELSAMAPDLAQATPRERTQRLAALATRHLYLRAPVGGGDSPGETTESRILWLSEFALRLASCSRDTVKWAGNKLYQAISDLLEAPGLARVARFLVLAVAREGGTSAFGSDLYEGWVWQ